MDFEKIYDTAASYYGESTAAQMFRDWTSWEHEPIDPAELNDDIREDDVA